MDGDEDPAFLHLGKLIRRSSRRASSHRAADAPGSSLNEFETLGFGSEDQFSLADELQSVLDDRPNGSLLDELGLNEHGDLTADVGHLSMPASPDRPVKKASTASTVVVDATQEADEALMQDSSALLAFVSVVPSFLTRLGASIDDSRTDRTSYEETISTLIKRTFECAKKREAQTRELSEIHRILTSRHDAEWMAALSETDDLPSMDDKPPHLASIDEHSHELQVPASPSTPLASPLSPTFPHRVQSPLTRRLADLKNATASAASSLVTINEATQVHKAAHSDVARKLKSLKGALSNIQTDMAALSRSMAFVEGHEQLSKAGFVVQVRAEVEEVHGLVERASRQAHELLAC
jgi:hypothetical protein